jgi:hypothetical protein
MKAIFIYFHFSHSSLGRKPTHLTIITPDGVELPNYFPMKILSRRNSALPMDCQIPTYT